MQGYIKLYRKMMKSQVWEDPNYLKLWMYCLMKASHKEHEILVGETMVNLKPGQFITGRKVITSELNEGMKPKYRQSESTWFRNLKSLEKLQMLNIKTTSKYSVISIINWKHYQESEQQMNSKRTTNEQQMNTNKNGEEGFKNGEELFNSNNNDNDFSEVIHFYQQNLQKGVTESPFNTELIVQLFDECGKDLLLAAMKVAVKKEAKGVAFFEAVLKNWKEAGIETIEQARLHETQFKQKSKTNNVVPIRNDEKEDTRNYGF
ncbi:DnaD domain-containing protein [Paraliobacillus sediminis]|uniref:DnaD domain-containing protein n=1 Tax=Paraliobacillus sediminis TaxID=1885916 RepID=UPI000E3E3572|nr:DnaD domain protein [Paraliobacillus sediminis]